VVTVPGGYVVEFALIVLFDTLIQSNFPPKSPT
jgi:hypothetical protein